MIAANQLILPAPAKLNLFLHVTGRRADGYHTLESLFVLIDRCDIVTLDRRSDGAIVRARGAASVSEESDLAVRAARLVAQKCKVGGGVTISVDKFIPAGSGLGGGSSDAATVLLGLNRLWQLQLSRASLLEYALELGADVPFFVHGEPAFATGIGERLTPFSVPPTWFVVLTPPTHVSTAAVFAAPELTRHTASAKILLFFEGHGRNDLQDVAAARFPEVIQCLEALEAAGETGARMTGSGGCVFSAFPSEGSAELALSRIRHERGIDGFVTRTVPRHPLWQFA